MTTTDTDALTERIRRAFLSEGPWRAACEAVMRYEGYTDGEVAEAHGPITHTDECANNGYPFGYDCTDEEGRDQHPLHTRARELDDTYRLFFEESPLATAVLPIIAAEVRAGKAEALRSAADIIEDMRNSAQVAEVAVYVPGEVGRQNVIDSFDAAMEEPGDWLRSLADSGEADTYREDYVNAWLAEAWDEGFQDGRRYDGEGDDGPRYYNPYSGQEFTP